MKSRKKIHRVIRRANLVLSQPVDGCSFQRLDNTRMGPCIVFVNILSHNGQNLQIITVIPPHNRKLYTLILPFISKLWSVLSTVENIQTILRRTFARKSVWLITNHSGRKSHTMLVPEYNQSSQKCPPGISVHALRISDKMMLNLLTVCFIHVSKQEQLLRLVYHTVQVPSLTAKYSGYDPGQSKIT